MAFTVNDFLFFFFFRSVTHASIFFSLFQIQQKIGYRISNTEDARYSNPDKLVISDIILSNFV